MALHGQQEEGPEPGTSPTQLRMIVISIKENYKERYSPLENADQCKMELSPPDTDHPREQGTAEHNSMKKGCRSGDLSMNDKRGTTARNRLQFKACSVGQKRISTQIHVWAKRDRHINLSARQSPLSG